MIALFTSSQISRLMSEGRKSGSIGEPFYTYVQEKIWEQQLGQPINGDDGGKATSWGLVCEKYLLEHKLGTEYVPMMDERIIHPEIERWGGSPDARNTQKNSVVELKSPYTLTSFCGLAEPVRNGLSGLEAMNYIRDNHKDGEKYYWQCVSNYVLTKADCVEFMVFCPFFEELDEVKKMIDFFPMEEQYKFYWLANSYNKDLPHLIREGSYESIYTIEFIPPKKDINRLHDRLNLAIKMLVNGKVERT